MCALILWRSSLGLLMGTFCQFLTELSAGNRSMFSFLDDNFCKYQWIFTKLSVYIDIVESCFRIADRQISSIFDSYLPGTRPHFHFWKITLLNVSRFSPNLGVCIDIVDICFRIANGRILYIFDRVICLQHICVILSRQ